MESRELYFSEGSSDKFWRIVLDGSSHTVTFGRRGTGGQVKLKSFADEAAARREFEKLVMEKLRKGYLDAGGSAAPAPATPSPSASASAAPVTASASPVRTARARTAKPATAPESEPETPVIAAAVALTTPAPPLTPGERSIDLEPEDWATVTWRPCPEFRLPAGTRGRDEVLADIVNQAKEGVHEEFYGSFWRKANVPSAMTRDEALVWVAAFTTSYHKWSVDEQMERIRALEEVPPPNRLVERMVQNVHPKIERQCGSDNFRSFEADGLPGKLTYALSHFYSPSEIAEFVLLAAAVGKKHRWWDFVGLDWFGPLAWILRGSGAEELARVQAMVREYLKKITWPADTETPVPAALTLAAAAGLGDELLPLVASIPDTFYDDWDNYELAHFPATAPHSAIFGLPGRELVEGQIRRLKLPLVHPAIARWWIGQTGFERLGKLHSEYDSREYYSKAKEVAAVMALVRAPETAPVMLSLVHDNAAPEEGRAWLDAHPELAIPGLLATAAGSSPLAERALTYLRGQVNRGREDFVRQSLEQASPTVRDRITAQVLETSDRLLPEMDASSTPEWLSRVVTEAGKLKVIRPGWLEDLLPPLVCDGRKLNRAQIDALLGALQKSTLEAPHPLITAVREHTAAADRDRFAWGIFTGWLHSGASSKEKWAMTAVGFLGADESVNRMAPMIREWPGQNQHQRAVHGLECLRTIGSDMALLQINRIAQKVKFKALQTRARECMEAIAKSRGLTRAELEDRVVPDLGLDENGTRIFDYGTRQFQFVVGPDQKPMVRDGAGKITGDLPKPGVKDDAAKATEALAEWKALKKIFRDEVKVQAARLEQAMVTGRRWTAEEFDMLIVRHPFMNLLARQLVWAGYDSQGQLLRTFRVTEDNSLADSRDEATDLAGVEKTGIIHPLHLPAEDARAWGELFSDYAIVPPFAQLGRETHELEPAERNRTEIKRFEHTKVPPLSIWGTLDSRGWWRGQPQDAGCVFHHIKQFPSAGITAVATYDGIYISMPQEADDQSVSSCVFIPGLIEPDDWYHRKTPLALGKVDPMIISEVLRDLYTIASKAREV